jgi:hypothetical protein
MTEPIRKESIVEFGLWKSMAQARRDFTRRGVPTSCLAASHRAVTPHDEKWPTPD